MEWITSNINLLIIGGLGGVLAFCLDKVIKFIVVRFYPATFLRGLAKQLDSVIEDTKKKYPAAGVELENKVLASLNAAIKIIKN